MSNESNVKLNIVKQKIIASLLCTNYDMIYLCFARIYTGNANQPWLYSELEGGLALVLDYSRKTPRFLLFDLITLEITFECEWYKNFHVFYSCVNEIFQCFEVHGGFIGFSIPDKNSAKLMLKNVTSLTDQIISKKIKENKITNKFDMKYSTKKNLEILKIKISNEYYFKENLSCGKKIEFDAYQLEKLFNMIEWDSYTKSFVVKGNSDEIEDLMDKVASIRYAEKGTKVSDMRSYAMEIYNNMQTSSKVNKEYELKLIKKLQQEQAASNSEKKTDKKNDKNEKQTEKKIEKKVEKKVEEPKKTINKDSNVPQIPAGVPQVPKGVPQVPKGVPQVPKGVPQVPKGVPQVPTAVPQVPKGVPQVPKGVPQVPKGVPQVPKGVPQVPTAVPQVPKDIETTNSVTKSSINSENQQLNSESDGGNSVSTETTTPVVETHKKREPPKPSMMDELKAKLANRQSALANLPGYNNTNSNTNTSNPINNSTINTSIPINNSTNNTNILLNTSSLNETSNTSNTEIKEKQVISITPKLNNANDLNNNTKIESSTSTSAETDGKLSMKQKMEALSKKMGGGGGDIKPSINVPENKPITIVNNNTTVKTDFSKIAQQLEKSYLSGSDTTVGADKISVDSEVSKRATVVNPTVNNTVVPNKNIPPVNESQVSKPVSSTPLPKGGVPPVPKGVPPVPKVLPPKAPVVSKTPPTTVKPKVESDKCETLQEQIAKGVKLKKVVTVDKSGIDYLKKQKKSFHQDDQSSSSTNTGNSDCSTTNREVKGDLFSEMRKVQLKKINK